MFFLATFDSLALSPSDVFDKTKEKISSAKTLSANFNMNINGENIKGQLYSKGKKFSLFTGVISNWYNGTDLYTYDSSNGETYIFRPTASELAEVNPLLYLNSAKDYKISGSKTKTKGIETIVLLPVKSTAPVKNIIFQIDSKTFLPISIRIFPKSGQTIDINLSNIKLNGVIGDNTFVYPKNKYPKAKITDMR